MSPVSQKKDKIWLILSSACSGDICVPSCEHGWEQFGNNCYFFNMEGKNWAAAEDFCQNEGGHLASIATEAVNTFMGEKKKTYWIGGHDRDEEGSWRWTDCTPMEFTFWAPGEPNDGSARGQDCMQYYGHSRKWDDDTCSNGKSFVCSKKICTGPISICTSHNSPAHWNQKYMFLGCSTEKNIDYHGNDISGKVVLESMQACADLCASTPGGLFWTYSPTNKHCYVKSSNSGRTANAHSVSGNRECGSEGEKNCEVFCLPWPFGFSFWCARILWENTIIFSFISCGRRLGLLGLMGQL